MLKKVVNIIDVKSEQTFGIFYNSYYHRFFRYAYYYVNNKHTAEDITHDALLYYWENRENIPPETDVLGYIMLTVKNKCLNYLKHLKVENSYNKKYIELQEWEIRTRIMTLEDQDYDTIFTNEIMNIVTASLTKLPQQTQFIFIENRFKNKSRKEIAAEMGVSLQKIDYHINKANEHLYKELKDYLPIIAIFFPNFF